jgi:hypothetical protein
MVVGFSTRVRVFGCSTGVFKAAVLIKPPNWLKLPRNSNTAL